MLLPAIDLSDGQPVQWKFYYYGKRKGDRTTRA
jgi:phosphoribosylformimino-5-aminoimidazole carboxamide ribonucleotide (ProFAR) isomerase